MLQVASNIIYYPCLVYTASAPSLALSSDIFSHFLFRLYGAALNTLHEQKHLTLRIIFHRQMLIVSILLTKKLNPQPCTNLSLRFSKNRASDALRACGTAA